MLLNQQIQRLGAKIGHDTGRVPQSHRPVTGGQQPLEDVVYGQIARGAGQHLFATVDRPTDYFYNGSRFASARRPVNQGHIAGGQGEPHGLPLDIIEPGIKGRLILLDIELRRPSAQ
jgi:hypothetical protein